MEKWIDYRFDSIERVGTESKRGRNSLFEVTTWRLSDNDRRYLERRCMALLPWTASAQIQELIPGERSPDTGSIRAAGSTLACVLREPSGSEDECRVVLVGDSLKVACDYK